MNPSLPTIVWLLPPSAGVPIDGDAILTHDSCFNSCMKLSGDDTRPIVNTFSCLNPKGASTKCFNCITIIIEQASMVMVIIFCTTMNTLLNTIFVLCTNVPRTISIGSTLDATTAGMTPDTTPVNTSTARIIAIATGLNSSDISIFVLSNSPKLSAKAKVSNKAMTKAMPQSKVLSPTKRMAISRRCAPKSRRAAISRARFPDCATVRFT